MKNTLKIVIFLAIISCLSGLAIGIVNSYAEPRIEENERIAEKNNLEKIFPNAEFNELEYKNDSILTVYEVEGKGYIFKATAKGYNTSNPIVTLIGMDIDGTIINVIALSEQETSGVGTKCFEENNINSLYIGKKLGEEVDGITGATFTSKAMKEMIKAAQDAFGEVK